MLPGTRWIVGAAVSAALGVALPGPSPPAAGEPPRAPAEPAYGTYAWPVNGPVLRGFEPPSSVYGPGHRGVDIGAPLGTAVRAASDGTVAFAGWVAGSLFVSVDHPDGVRTTYSWLSEALVGRGDAVAGGTVIARSGAGHPGSAEPHLHLGARYGEAYLDPMLLLERGSLVGLVRLAPLEEPPP